MRSILVLCACVILQGALHFWQAQGFPLCRGARPFRKAPISLLDRRTTILGESSQPDYEAEETLLKVHLAVQPGVSLDEAKEAVAKYSQSFPFAAVLPVQPLQYLPTEDQGVEIKFLRKKTDIKSGIDGGIRFFVESADGGLDITAKRNSKGQTIQKMMAEKLVVKAFVSGITGEENAKYGQAPLDVVRVTSLYHKWMQQ